MGTEWLSLPEVASRSRSRLGCRYHGAWCRNWGDGRTWWSSSTANVVADSTVTALWLSTESMQKIMEESPELSMSLWKTAAMRFAENLLGAKEPYNGWNQMHYAAGLMRGKYFHLLMARVLTCTGKLPFCRVRHLRLVRRTFNCPCSPRLGLRLSSRVTQRYSSGTHNFHRWRRGRDSNLRYLAVYSISNAAIIGHSVTSPWYDV